MSMCMKLMLTLSSRSALTSRSPFVVACWPTALEWAKARPFAGLRSVEGVTDIMKKIRISVGIAGAVLLKWHVDEVVV